MIPQLEIFHQLKQLTSIKDKEQLISKFQNEDYLANLFYLNLNPYMMFHIKEIPTYITTTSSLLTSRQAYINFVKLADKLNKREVTGNAAKHEVASFMAEIDQDEAEVYKMILLKEPIGVGAKTVNKVWPNLVPEFEIMLAPNELPIITQVKYPTYIQPKLDGYRCVYYNGEMWSRAGKPFGNTNLSSYFNSLYNVDDYVLDGELIDTATNFNKLQRILNNHNAPLPSTLKYVVYDAMPKAEWEAQKCKQTYSDRIRLVRGLLNNNIADYSKVIDISNDLVQSSKEAIDIYKNYLNKGYEGAMLKDPDGLYRWKRTTVRSGEMLKLKPFKSVDVAITGFYEGEGKLKGNLGGIIVALSSGSTCNIGSGFIDSIRKEIWDNQSKYLGKTVEIKYFEETEDGSLRFPIFQRFREDKD